MLKMSQIQTFTQKSDFIQTTFDLKVRIQTFAENSDQSGRPANAAPACFKYLLQTLEVNFCLDDNFSYFVNDSPAIHFRIIYILFYLNWTHAFMMRNYLFQQE